MNERLLQFIWQFQHYNKHDLYVTSGKALRIFYHGHVNSDQGPDFLNARISIGEQLWAGNIELHIRSTDWKRHGHQTDSNYSNVILHVVWIDDEKAPQNEIPVLELAGRVPKSLLTKYDTWMHTYSDFIPCASQIGLTDSSILGIWYDELILKRLENRTRIIQQKLSENIYHWDEIFWCMLMRNFGIRVNADAFESIATSMPLNLLIKHKNQIHAVEALLFGQAGLLEQRFSEQYPIMLQKEYRFYRKKYGLKPIYQPIHFLRMRPVNFPTVRLAQLAMIVHTAPAFFSFARDCEDPQRLRSIFTVTANDYWHYHYRFDESSAFQPKQTGKDIIDNIFINTIAPAIFAYGTINNLPHCIEKGLSWLKKTSAENNPIIRRFLKVGIKPANAYESQSLLELKFRFCDDRKCLECRIGNSLLKQSGQPGSEVSSEL